MKHHIDTTFFEENGYLLIRQLFDVSTVEKIKSELGALASHEADFPPGAFVLEDNHAEIRKNSTNPLDWIRKIDYPAMSRSAHLMTIFRDASSDMVRICSKLIGEEHLRLVFLSTFAKPPHGGSEIPWHQDQALWDLWMHRALSGWVALSKTTDENGVLQIVPGSHKWGMTPHRQYPGKIHESIAIADYPAAKPVKVYMEPGDCVFFGGKTWHFSEPNNSPNRRLGMPVVYGGENDMKAGLDCDEWMKSKLQLEKPLTSLPMTGERRAFFTNCPATQ